MSFVMPTTILGRTSYLGGIVRYWKWGKNIMGPAKIYRNGRGWGQGVTRVFTVFGFGIAEYDRVDDQGKMIIRHDKNGRPIGWQRSLAFGFFRVEASQAR